MVKIYQAYDGTQFESVDECLAYENSNEEVAEARKSAEIIKKYCMSGDCTMCIFKSLRGYCMFNRCDSPEEWDSYEED